MDEKRKDQFKDNEEVRRAITLGESICEKIKSIYFIDIPWIKCYQDVAVKYTELKKIMRKFYSDKSEIEMLMTLQKYSEQDIAEIFAK